jgi:DNA mismatch repair ATPase MutS
VCAAYYGWGGDYQPHWIDTVDQTPGIRVARMMHLEEEAKELAMNRTSAELEERKKRKQEELEMREKKSSAESFEAKLAKQEQALRDLKK